MENILIYNLVNDEHLKRILDNYEIILTNLESELLSISSQEGYDLAIICEHESTNTLSNVLELILDKDIPVIYISNSTDYSYIYNLIHHHQFHLYKTNEFYSNQLDIIKMILKMSKYCIKINQKLENTVRLYDELNMINKAKYMLMGTMEVSESNAHNHIQKEAMNQRISRYEVSRKLLSD